MSTPSGNADQGNYVLGHSERELDRLRRQARLIDPLTTHYFRDAGIAPGMRVLDVGSGAGDVSFLVAGLVGDGGEVLGIDRSPAAVARARATAAASGLRNVSFHEGDPADMTFDAPFDAVVGRYVLMFQPDPTQMLKKLVGHVSPGGLIAFHEPDWNGVRSFPSVPTYDRCCQWIVETLLRRGADPRMGIKLHAAFVGAGLAAPTLRLQSLVAGGTRSTEEVRFKTDLAETLASEMERLGVATAAEVGVETLAARVMREVVSSQSVIVGRAEIGAWAHV